MTGCVPQRVFLARVLCILTRDFRSLDVQAGLILEPHLLVVSARVEVGGWVRADLSPPSSAVAEGEGASEGTLYEVARLSEHGVEWCIAGDHVAEGLHGLDVFLAIACKEARSFPFVSTAFISRRTALRRLCGTGVKVRHAEGIKNGLVTRASMGRRQKGGISSTALKIKSAVLYWSLFYCLVNSQSKKIRFYIENLLKIAQNSYSIVCMRTAKKDEAMNTEFGAFRRSHGGENGSIAAAGLLFLPPTRILCFLSAAKA